jgi:VWFA-related protein
MFLVRPLPYLLLPALLAVGAAAVPSDPRAPSQSTTVASILPGYGEVVEINLVDIDVTVTDRAGNRVTSLRKGDFALFEDGKPMEITNFSAVEPPPRPASGSSRGAVPPAPASGQAGSGLGRETLQLVVFVDDLHLAPAHRTRALRQVRQFLEEQVGPDDRVMLVAYDTELAIRVPFTSDRAAWNAALDRIEATAPGGLHGQEERRLAFQMILAARQDLSSRGADPCSKMIEQPVRAYAGATRQEVRRTLGAMGVLVNSLAGIPGRKALLHVSDGLPLTPGEELFQALYELCSGNGDPGLLEDDLTSKGEPHKMVPLQAGSSNTHTVGLHALLDAQDYSAAKELHRLAAQASANRVTLYMLQASGLEGNEAAVASYDPNERMMSSTAVNSTLRANLQASLSLLADETGGRAILHANDLRPDLDRMRDDFATYYSLAFTPPHRGDGRTRAIEVRINRPGLRAAYRKSYRDKPPLERAADRTLTALLTGAGDNPLDVQVEVGEPLAGQDGLFGVPIRLRIPLFKLGIANRQGSFEGQLRLLVATRGDNGQPSPVRQVKVPIHIGREDILAAMGKYFLYNVTLQLPKGDNRFAIAVRDELAATSSFVSGNVRLPAPPAAKPAPGPAHGLGD